MWSPKPLSWPPFPRLFTLKRQQFSDHIHLESWATLLAVKIFRCGVSPQPHSPLLAVPPSCPLQAGIRSTSSGEKQTDYKEKGKKKKEVSTSGEFFSKTAWLETTTFIFKPFRTKLPFSTRCLCGYLPGFVMGLLTLLIELLNKKNSVHLYCQAITFTFYSPSIMKIKGTWPAC